MATSERRAGNGRNRDCGKQTVPHDSALLWSLARRHAASAVSIIRTPARDDERVLVVRRQPAVSRPHRPAIAPEHRASRTWRKSSARSSGRVRSVRTSRCARSYSIRHVGPFVNRAADAVAGQPSRDRQNPGGALPPPPRGRSRSPGFRPARRRAPLRTPPPRTRPVVAPDRWPPRATTDARRIGDEAILLDRHVEAHQIARARSSRDPARRGRFRR